MSKIMVGEFNFRSDTLANWTAANPILGVGEPGFVTDTTPVRMKIGNGVTPWKSLPFVVGTNILSGTVNESGHLVLTMLDESVVDCGNVKGASGSPGTDGVSPTISIGTVTTVPAGTSASVVNTGTPTALVLDFNLPKGADGTGAGDMQAAVYDPIIKAITGEDTVGTAPDATLAVLWGLKWSEKYLLTNPATGYCGHVLSLTRKGALQDIKFRVQGTVSAATTVNLFAGGTNTITAALTNSATSITVANAPTATAPYYALLDPYGAAEVVQVTAISGTTLTITRAQCGTTAVAHNSGVIAMPIVATVSISAAGVTTYTPGATLTLDEDTLLVYNVSGAGFAAANVSISAKWGNA
ncbi:MAG: hypothetical protein VB133_09605 [Anaeromusa sp.]|uniref:hyaluronate lyase N-terminal domain-containing protein n=1 Tax=Anaeromusa sp. TaxID=1872520 RepID=UPI002B21EAF3|nr:hypothetical protein [Anaeromusa sp.]MEA4835379.1 hypothetical protein [Anaeromusa sp.]